MLETSESTGMEHAERHPVGGVVLTKITPDDESGQYEIPTSMCPNEHQN